MCSEKLIDNTINEFATTRITRATQIFYSLPILIYCRLLGGIVKQFKLSILQQPVKNISKNLKKNWLKNLQNNSEIS